MQEYDMKMADACLDYLFTGCSELTIKYFVLHMLSPIQRRSNLQVVNTKGWFIIEGFSSKWASLNIMYV